jgi:hypothetical protein
MSPDQVASAEDALRHLLEPEVAQLMVPLLRPEHRSVVEAIERLGWGVESLGVVADQALNILATATASGGPLIPSDHDSDVPWVTALGRIASAPAIGSKVARHWFVHLERLLGADVPVSEVTQAIAAYAVARFEDDLGSEHEVWWWTQMAATQTEGDGRVGLGLAVASRAARLLGWEAHMVRIRYSVEFTNEDRPSALPAETRAVLASACEQYDVGQGGVTFEEVSPEDVQQLGVFPVWTEVFVESSAEGDVLDDTDETTSATSRIWWRAVVVERATQ